MDGYDNRMDRGAGVVERAGRHDRQLARRHRPEHGRALPSAAPCSAVGGRRADFRLRLDVPRGRRDGPAHVRRPLPARLRRARDPGRPRGAAGASSGARRTWPKSLQKLPLRPGTPPSLPVPNLEKVLYPLLLRRLLHRVLAAGVCRSDPALGIASPTSRPSSPAAGTTPSPPTWPRSTRCWRDAAGRRNGCCSGRGTTWGWRGFGATHVQEVDFGPEAKWGTRSTARSACGGSIAGSRSWTRGWTPIRRCACSSMGGGRGGRTRAGRPPTTAAAGEASGMAAGPCGGDALLPACGRQPVAGAAGGGGGRRGGEMDARTPATPCPPSAERSPASSNG